MNCKHCKAKWTPPANMSLTICPLCQRPLIEANDFGENSKPDKILLEIVKLFGRQKLSDGVKLSGILKDLMPYVEKKYQSVFDQAVKYNIGTKLLELENEDAAIRTARIDVLKDSFRKNNSLA